MNDSDFPERLTPTEPFDRPTDPCPVSDPGPVWWTAIDETGAIVALECEVIS